MNITSTSPSPDETGILQNAVVEVTFDEVIDLDSIIDSGNFFITTSAQKVVALGAGVKMYDVGESNFDPLASDQFTGFVEGSVTTTDSLTFTFRPDSIFTPNTEYRVIVSDGVVTPTLSDVTPGVGNTGTGDMDVKGPYTGTLSDTYTITITGAGRVGEATFRWSNAESGLSSQYVLERSVLIDNGLTLEFKEGDYELADSWSFDTTEGVSLGGHYTFTFTTGQSELQSVPVEEESIGLVSRVVDGLRRVEGVVQPSEEMRVISITPEDLESNIPLGRPILIEFDKEIDPASLTTATIKVVMETLPVSYEEPVSVELYVQATLFDTHTLQLRFVG